MGLPYPQRFTASGAISDGPVLIHGVVLKGGSDAATADIANQATAGGDSLIPLVAAAGAVDRPPLPAQGVHMTVAAYLTLTGTNSWAVVYKSTPSGSSYT